MKRNAYDELLQWKKRRKRKPLLLRGARQTGKTWLMNEFAKSKFDDFVYFLCDNNTQLMRIFEPDYNIQRIIRALEVEAGKKLVPGKTVIIFDEIQEIPKALSALKYFCETAPEYPIMAAGSLMGIALHEGTNFPVGKVDEVFLYPLSFNEFLTALGEDPLRELLIQGDTGMISTFADRYRELLKLYYFIGGMPEAVQSWLDEKDPAEVRRIQNGLLDFYDNDFSKHADPRQVTRIRMVWGSVLSQLAKENRKFIYGLLRKGSRASDFDLAISWLKDYGLTYRVHRITKPGLPLKSYENLDQFKMFALDVGLLGAMGGLDASVLMDGSRIFEEFKGALTEQFICQQLISEDSMIPWYWSAENSGGEVDFVVQTGNQILPIEVKAEENLRARSLRAFCDKYKISRAVRTSMSPYREQDWLVNVPLYYFSEWMKKER